MGFELKGTYSTDSLWLRKILLKIKFHQVKPLFEGVQTFKNGDCCEVIIEENKNLDEVINLLVDIQK